MSNEMEITQTKRFFVFHMWRCFAFFQKVAVLDVAYSLSVLVLLWAVRGMERELLYCYGAS